MCPRSVLIVDDNEDLAASLADYLRLDGHVVDTAFSGKAGLDAACVTAYDLVVVDVGLPDVNGIDTMRAIQRARPGACVVLVTGHSAAYLEQAHGDASAVEVITKPVHPEQLSQRLDSISDGKDD